MIPAVGFDVVPSDCLAAMLANRLPGARVLQLAFTDTSGLSAGTAKTMVEALPAGGRVRIDGQIRYVPTAWKIMEVPFRDRTLSAISIPWGDVASAFYSTGIPNIEVYAATPPWQIAWTRRLRFLLPMLGWRPIQALAKRYIAQDQGSARRSARDGARLAVGPRQRRPRRERLGHAADPQRLSAHCAHGRGRAAKSRGRRPAPGFSTASQAFGREFILSFPGTDIRWEDPRPTEPTPKPASAQT